MRDLLSITKALSDETRLRAFAALRSGELCVCQIVALLEMAPSTVSKHMSILRQAGLVESRKVARWVHYSLPDRKAPRIVRDAIAFAFEHVEGSEKIAHDAVRLGKIVRMRLEDLCAGRCK